MINENFVIVGSVILLIGSTSYLIDTIKGNIQPNKVTWLLWAIMPFIVFSAEIKEGVGIVSSVTFMAGFMPLLIFLSSFINKKSYWHISRLDIGCGILSVIGLLLWYLTKTSDFAIIFSIAADILAALPTVKKSYSAPLTENSLEYFASATSGIIALLTIKVWDLAHVGFPLYVLFINLFIAILVKYKIGKKI